MYFVMGIGLAKCKYVTLDFVEMNILKVSNGFSGEKNQFDVENTNWYEREPTNICF